MNTYEPVKPYEPDAEKPVEIPTIRFVESLMETAFLDAGSLEFRIMPDGEDYIYRARVQCLKDGKWEERHDPIPAHITAAVRSRVKILGGLSIAVRNRSQGGEVVSQNLKGRGVFLRVIVVLDDKGREVVHILRVA